MKLLLQAVKLIDPRSKYHLDHIDILIEAGIITQIAKKIKALPEYKVFKEKALVSPSWIDTNMHIYEPGLEYREDFKSGLKAAAAGGFGLVCIMPNTNPPVDNNAQLAFIKQAAQHALTEVYPYGAVSHKIEGKDLAEIYDMHEGGPIAFTDGSKAISNAGLLERALLYVKKFKGVILNNPDNRDLSEGAQMNEGINSTVLGMQGAPKLAEELMVSRDLFLLEESQSRLHFINVSTQKSVALIKAAKAKGLAVSAGVNVANLFFDDDELLDYDTNFKVHPHLRNKEDIKALLSGLKDGTIDVICSGHKPLHEDEKKVEFENASFGMSTIDCAFAVSHTATSKVLNEEVLIDKWLKGYELIGLPIPKIEVGERADLSIFNFDEKATFQQKDILSKGKNNPFVGRDLTGTVYGIVKGNKTNIL
jgi:dihydroorotase